MDWDHYQVRTALESILHVAGLPVDGSQVPSIRRIIGFDLDCYRAEVVLLGSDPRRIRCNIRYTSLPINGRLRCGISPTNRYTNRSTARHFRQQTVDINLGAVRDRALIRSHLQVGQENY